MKIFTAILSLVLLFIVSCKNNPIKSDPVDLADSQARYQSIITTYYDETEMGPRTLFVSPETPNILTVKGVFAGNYRATAPSCDFVKEGSYEGSFTLDLTTVLKPSEVEKTCTLFLTVQPNRIGKKTVAMFDRFSIYQIVNTRREHNRSVSVQVRQSYVMPSYTLDAFEPDQSGEFNMVGKCVNDAESFTRIGKYVDGKIHLNLNDLSALDSTGKVIGVQDGSIKHCYFSILLNKGADGKFLDRIGFTLTTYANEHSPLILTFLEKGKYMNVTGPESLYYCEVNGVIEEGQTSCRTRINTENKYEATGHTNKRSFFGKSEQEQ